MSIRTDGDHWTPQGFESFVVKAGEDGNTVGFVCVASRRPCHAAALFTRSRFAGPCVLVSRETATVDDAQGIVTVVKNSNVATGQVGLANAREVVEGVAAQLGVRPEKMLVAATGTTGRRWPMDEIRERVNEVGAGMGTADFANVAAGIMTTDLVPKIASARVGEAAIVGVAKGVGMVEPNMATVLVYLFTDAEVPVDALDASFRAAVNRTFNCLSVDTDTSTSDSAIIFANGAAGPVDADEFARAVDGVAQALVRMLARDGEGATKLIEVTVNGGRDYEQAKRVAKSVVNSPVVKTAIHGEDPNWGRIAVAIGKCEADTDIEPERTTIAINDLEVFPADVEDRLPDLARLLSGDEIVIGIDLGIGSASATVWGCDMSTEYVKINAEYST
jgi:glutamate N-acetyltransferase/amino-acid N-acetyltransferase